VANYLPLRQTVGWLGTLLPVILLIANPIVKGQTLIGPLKDPLPPVAEPVAQL